MLKREGQVRIPAGCAISGIFSRSGAPVNGGRIVQSIAAMHDRSNGLGGGFAGYGIYPGYKDYFAMHVFSMTRPHGGTVRNFCSVISTSSTSPASPPAR